MKDGLLASKVSYVVEEVALKKKSSAISQSSDIVLVAILV